MVAVKFCCFKLIDANKRFDPCINHVPNHDLCPFKYFGLPLVVRHHVELATMRVGRYVPEIGDGVSVTVEGSLCLEGYVVEKDDQGVLTVLALCLDAREGSHQIGGKSWLVIKGPTRTAAKLQKKLAVDAGTVLAAYYKSV